MESQYMEANGQWIELQPLYNQGNFVQGLPQSYDGAVSGPSSTSPNHNQLQKSGEPDPIIEEIVDGNKYPDLKHEIQMMLK